MRRALIAAVITMICGLSPARAADAAFTQFIASLWPEAQAAGVSRATFDEQTRGLEPDYKLPDLILATKELGVLKRDIRSQTGRRSARKFLGDAAGCLL